MIKPQKPYLVSINIEVFIFPNIPLKIILQIYPRTIPPIKFGMKNAVLNKFAPFIPNVNKYAIANASIFIKNSDTIAYNAVYQNACINDASLNASM